MWKAFSLFLLSCINYHQILVISTYKWVGKIRCDSIILVEKIFYYYNFLKIYGNLFLVEYYWHKEKLIYLNK